MSCWYWREMNFASKKRNARNTTHDYLSNCLLCVVLWAIHPCHSSPAVRKKTLHGTYNHVSSGRYSLANAGSLEEEKDDAKLKRQSTVPMPTSSQSSPSRVKCSTSLISQIWHVPAHSSSLFWTCRFGSTVFGGVFRGQLSENLNRALRIMFFELHCCTWVVSEPYWDGVRAISWDELEEVKWTW